MNLFLTIAAGLFSGGTASLGLGGGFVLLLYLTLLVNMQQKEAQLINLLFFVPIAVVALVLHLKNKLVELPLLVPTLIGGAVGVLLGWWFSSFIQSEILQKLFAVMVLISGIKCFIRKGDSHT